METNVSMQEDSKATRKKYLVAKVTFFKYDIIEPEVGDKYLSPEADVVYHYLTNREDLQVGDIIVVESARTDSTFALAYFGGYSHLSALETKYQSFIVGRVSPELVGYHRNAIYRQRVAFKELEQKVRERAWRLVAEEDPQARELLDYLEE